MFLKRIMVHLVDKVNREDCRSNQEMRKYEIINYVGEHKKKVSEVLPIPVIRDFLF